MKWIFCLSTLILFSSWSAWAQTPPIKVIAAAATSSAANSVEPSCLLDTTCKGTWSPGAKDSGVNEGLYFQFETPTKLYAIDVDTDSASPMKVSVNGVPVPPAQNGIQNGLRFMLQPTREGKFKAREVKSVFIRIIRDDRFTTDKPVLKGIRFYATGDDLSLGEPTKVSFPKTVKGTVTATSTLEPARAYRASNLFDSKYDIAWSTNGKKSAGTNESLTVNLNESRTITGLILWNGYQRSLEHFQANGRVKSLEVSNGTDQNTTIEIKDSMGNQRLQFTKPLTNVKKLTFKIKSIYPGAKYKDVLLSELRLIGPGDELLVLNTPAESVQSPNSLAKFIDTSFSSPYTVGPNEMACFTRSLRLRSDGSFVSYLVSNSEGHATSTVLEGNWEPNKDTVRIFGKRYKRSEDYREIAYGEGKALEGGTDIFQADLRIKKFSAATEKEKNQAAVLLLEDLDAKKHPFQLTEHVVFEADESLDSRTKRLVRFLSKKDPLIIQSPTFSGLFVPTDEAPACN